MVNVKGWARKEPATKFDDGPLTGVALARLQAMDSRTLYDWADASISKIGKLLLDVCHGGPPEMLIEAQIESRALLQAIEELASRKS